MDVVIGSNVSWTSASQGDVIRFYDSDCRVIGQFAATGSTLDSAVYMNFDTCKALIQACREKGLFKYGDFDGERSISSVMVRVKKGYAAEEVAKAIRARLDGVSVVTASDMLLGLSENLSRVSGAARTLMLVLCLLGFFMAVTVFALMINERQREFATLRAMGASKSMVARVVLREAAAANLAG
ncbi:MAG: ABC transporter permease, partial [Clostridia bacterium]|nr:ABC transporter permease [Clostridia bacterium]